MREPEADVARKVLETVPAVMRFIRGEMRRGRTTDLNVVQFRTLVFVDKRTETSLGEVAGHLGLSPASITKMVDGLETRGLATRVPSRADRRRVRLTLTQQGRRMMETARRQTQEALAAVLCRLAPEDLRAVRRAMVALGALLSAKQ